MSIQGDVSALGRQFLLKRIPIKEELIPARLDQQLEHVHETPTRRSLDQFWEEVKETTGVSQPMTRDEYIAYNAKELEKVSPQMKLGGIQPELVNSLFPKLLPRLTTHIKEQGKRAAGLLEIRQLATATEAIEQHTKKIKQAMKINQRETNPVLRQERQERLQLSLAHASQLTQEAEIGANPFRSDWLPDEVFQNQMGQLSKVFGSKPGATEKVSAIIEVHNILQDNVKKMHLKVETLSALQSALAEAPNAAEKKALKDKFRKKTKELQKLIAENSAIIQKVKTNKIKRKLGPRFFARLDSLQDTGSLPLDILVKRGIRLGQTETVNMLLNAGADYQVVADELLSWKLGFTPPPRVNWPPEPKKIEQ